MSDTLLSTLTLQEWLWLPLCCWWKLCTNSLAWDTSHLTSIRISNSHLSFHGTEIKFRPQPSINFQLKQEQLNIACEHQIKESSRFTKESSQSYLMNYLRCKMDVKINQVWSNNLYFWTCFKRDFCLSKEVENKMNTNGIFTINNKRMKCTQSENKRNRIIESIRQIIHQSF